MKLVGSYTSPFVRKLSILLLEKGITFEFINELPYNCLLYTSSSYSWRLMTPITGSEMASNTRSAINSVPTSAGVKPKTSV